MLLEPGLGGHHYDGDHEHEAVDLPDPVEGAERTRVSSCSRPARFADRESTVSASPPPTHIVAARMWKKRNHWYQVTAKVPTGA